MRERQAAVERMREMNSRAVPDNSDHPMPPFPSFVKLQNNGQNTNQRPKENSAPRYNTQNEIPTPPQPMKKSRPTGGFDLPFLDFFTQDGDITLIVGLLLILMSEKSDKKLLFALIYILL